VNGSSAGQEGILSREHAYRYKNSRVFPKGCKKLEGQEAVYENEKNQHLSKNYQQMI